MNHLHSAWRIDSLCAVLMLVGVMLSASIALASEPLQTGSLTGIVVDVDGKPVAGASVFLDDHDYIAHAFRPTEKTITGADGSFHLDGLKPVYRGDHPLRIVAADFATQTIPVEKILIFAGANNDLGKIRLSRGQSITCRLLDFDGKPRAGMVV